MKKRCSRGRVGSIGNRLHVRKKGIPMSSLPKNDANACMVALAYAVAPDTWSGYGGVISAGPIPATATGSAGLNSGVQVGSDSVAGLPSSANRIAVIGRQNL